MYEEKFKKRLVQLREQKGVSAREMSLAIGQNANYINNIETGKALPSMTGFFYICEYLGIEPGEFFDTQTDCPTRIRELTEELKRLDGRQLDSIAILVQGLIKK